MNNLKLLIIVLVLALTLIIVSSRNTTFFDNETYINVLDNEGIKKKELEEYVLGVVAGEMPASFEMEALKAQAVASRTYAAYKLEKSNKDYDVLADISDQVYIDEAKMQEKWGNDFKKYYDKIKMAVDATKGLVLKCNDAVIKAYYFSMSNGYTEDVSLVFNEERNYLESVESIYDNEELKNFSVTTSFTKEEFLKRLGLSGKEVVVGKIERSKTNRVNKIVINNEEFIGTNFRKLLSLRSTDFDISVVEELVVITTRGYGHGVGMSQYGANGMAKNGSSYIDILKHYYKNIEITDL